MKKLFLLICILTTYTTSFAQNYKQLDDSVTDSFYVEYLDCPIDYGFSEYFVYYPEGDLADDYILYFCGIRNDHNYLVAMFKHESFYGLNKCYFEWSEDTLSVSTGFPFKGYTITSKHKFTLDTVYTIGEYSYDPCQEEVDLGDSCLEAGDYYGAIDHYYSVCYYHNYIHYGSVAAILITRSYAEAKEAYDNNSLDSTHVNNLGASLDFASDIVFYTWIPDSTEYYESEFWTDSITYQVYLTIIKDYASYCFEMGMYDLVVRDLTELEKVMPLSHYELLLLGNSQYEIGDKETAKITYTKYIELMKANGMKKIIPKYVKHRVK